MDKRLQIGWYIMLFLHGLCYCLPFLYSKMGIYFFGEGLEAFFEGSISIRDMPVFGAFFIPITLLPFMLFFYWRKKRLVVFKFWNRVFFFGMCCPTLLAAFFVMEKEGFKNDLGNWTFWLWACSFWILFWIYYQFQKVSQVKEKDIMEHLVD